MEYTTIATPSDSQFTEQRSRFLAFAHPVESPEEAKQIAKDYTRRFSTRAMFAGLI